MRPCPGEAPPRGPRRSRMARRPATSPCGISRTIDRLSKRAVCIMAKILIPTPLRPYTDKQDSVDAAGATVGELLADLTRKHAGLKAHLYNEQGKLRSFVNVYVNDEDIRYLQREATPVSAADTVSIIPSVAGGAPTTTDDVRS